MAVTIDADDAWCPPTFTPSPVSRSWLAAATMRTASHSTRRWSSSRAWMSSCTTSVSQGREDVAGHRVRRSDRIDVDDQPALAVVVDDRRGHVVVDLQPPANDVFGVVDAPLHERPCQQ